jgi:hypothetical protein
LRTRPSYNSLLELYNKDSAFSIEDEEFCYKNSLEVTNALNHCQYSWRDLVRVFAKVPKKLQPAIPLLLSGNLDKKDKASMFFLMQAADKEDWQSRLPADHPYTLLLWDRLPAYVKIIEQHASVGKFLRDLNKSLPFLDYSSTPVTGLGLLSESEEDEGSEAEEGDKLPEKPAVETSGWDLSELKEVKEAQVVASAGEEGKNSQPVDARLDELDEEGVKAGGFPILEEGNRSQLEDELPEGLVVSTVKPGSLSESEEDEGSEAKGGDSLPEESVAATTLWYFSSRASVAFFQGGLANDEGSQSQSIGAMLDPPNKDKVPSIKSSETTFRQVRAAQEAFLKAYDLFHWKQFYAIASQGLAEEGAICQRLQDALRNIQLSILQRKRQGTSQRLFQYGGIIECGKSVS